MVVVALTIEIYPKMQRHTRLSVVEKGQHARHETSVAIRKQQRGESLKQLRATPDTPIPSTRTSESIHALPTWVQQIQHATVQTTPYTEEEIQTLLHALIGIRVLVTTESNPPVDELYTSGALPILIALAVRFKTSEVVLMNIAWIFANAASASSPHIETLREMGGIEFLVAVLDTSYVSVHDYALWALGNIVGDGVVYRQYLTTQTPLLPQILRIVSMHTSPIEKVDVRTLYKTCAWVMSNFCRGTPSVDITVAPILVSILQSLLQGASSSASVVANVSTCISLLAEGSGCEWIDAIAHTSLVQTIVQPVLDTVEPSDSNIYLPVLRCIGNLMTGTNAAANAILADGRVYTLFAQALSSSNIHVVKECIWACSNVLAGDRVQVEYMRLEKRAFHQLMQRVQRTSNMDIQFDCMYCILNIVSHTETTMEQVQWVVEEGGLHLLATTLGKKEAGVKMVQVGLDILDAILARGEGDENMYATWMEEIGILRILDEKSLSTSPLVSQKATRVLDTFFSKE
jgi:hypothetical protein